MHKLSNIIAVILLFSFVNIVISSSGMARCDFEPDRKSDVQNIIVMISVEAKGFTEPIYGAGIVIRAKKEKAFIISASHLFRRYREKKDKIRIWIRERRYPIVCSGTVKSAKEIDLALLEVPIEGLMLQLSSFGIVGSTRRMAAGARLYGIGHSGGRRWWGNRSAFIFEKVFAENERYPEGYFSFQTGAVEGGFSGGALFDECWNWVGMLVVDSAASSAGIGVERILLAARKEWDVEGDLGVGIRCSSSRQLRLETLAFLKGIGNRIDTRRRIIVERIGAALQYEDMPIGRNWKSDDEKGMLNCILNHDALNKIVSKRFISNVEFTRGVLPILIERVNKETGNKGRVKNLAIFTHYLQAIIEIIELERRRVVGKVTGVEYSREFNRILVRRSSRIVKSMGARRR